MVTLKSGGKTRCNKTRLKEKKVEMTKSRLINKMLLKKGMKKVKVNAERKMVLLMTLTHIGLEGQMTHSMQTRETSEALKNVASNAIKTKTAKHSIITYLIQMAKPTAGSGLLKVINQTDLKRPIVSLRMITPA
jgi:hypothetical protein